MCISTSTDFCHVRMLLEAVLYFIKKVFIVICQVTIAIALFPHTNQVASSYCKLLF